MDDIIIQLQIEALDAKQDTGTLLRKAYLAAKKLHLTEFEKWVSKELNGYDSDDEIPTYRNIRGVVKFWNPYHGWLPVMIEDSELENVLSIRSLCEPVPKLIDLANTKERLHIPLPAQMSMMLSRMGDAPVNFEYAVFLDKSSIRNIVDIVKTKILEWSILLEDTRIHGAGMVFSSTEIESAQNPSIVNFTNNFYGSVNDTQLQQATQGSVQTGSER